MSETNGASNNERLLAAARSDNEDLIFEVFEDPDSFDINCQDGLGNTPLHNAVRTGSITVLEHILEYDGCDVDPVNRIDKATPLHLAVQLEHPELRLHIVESLLEAGADTSIKDKNGHTVLDYLPSDDTAIRSLITKQKAQASFSRDDIASDDDEEGDSGSGSGSDDD
ncbi:ankyrin repeat-containing domain protein [Crucibulum laeve]|uniref:Ankyrin repeat-containing domain protein n=1 Tax=Crucibulum laeve TaxID=68775 RepID=A0A5C3MBQ9_9AGAR|nr:ankyrin repeat-containing domain protein [Crucibulum laeve]